MNGLRLLLALGSLAGPAGAQGWTEGAAARAIEGPGHAALMGVMVEAGTSPVPFETDGCSGGLSEAWTVVAGRFPDFAEAHRTLPPWEACCVTHDRAYHDAGGATDAVASFDARLGADRALETCVVATGASRVDALAGIYDVPADRIEAAYDSVARAMFLAVRVGGAPCSGLPWRWGYGYPDCGALSAVVD